MMFLDLFSKEDEDKIENVTERQLIDDVDVDVVTVEKPFYCSRFDVIFHLEKGT